MASMKCVLICVCDVCCTSEVHCQLVNVYGVCVIPWKQADMVHGFQQWQDRHWQVMTMAPNMPTTDDARHTHLAADFTWQCTELSGTNCSTEKYVHTGCQRIPQMMTKLIVWDWMGPVLYLLDTCYIDQREQFWSWNMVDYTKPETRKMMCDERNYHLPPAKKMEALSSVKMTMVTLSCDCYCDTLSLWRPFFAKGLGLPKYCLFAWKCQVSYTQLDSCLWLYVW